MNAPHRFYVESPLAIGETITLPADRARQIARVLRLAPGDRIVLFNGDGTESLCAVAQVSKSGVSVVVEETRPGRPNPKPAIHLAQGLLKGDRFDLVVQKATELGVARITPVVTARTVVSLPADRAAQRRERWHRIAVEAAEQCGRVDVPVVSEPVRFEDLLPEVRRVPAVLLWEDEREISLARAGIPLFGQVKLIVGPEGGFSPDEVQAAASAGARFASLGPLILRSETAAIAAIAGVLALAGMNVKRNASNDERRLPQNDHYQTTRG